MGRVKQELVIERDLDVSPPESCDPYPEDLDEREAEQVAPPRWKAAGGCDAAMLAAALKAYRAAMAVPLLGHACALRCAIDRALEVQHVRGDDNREPF